MNQSHTRKAILNKAYPSLVVSSCNVTPVSLLSVALMSTGDDQLICEDKVTYNSCDRVSRWDPDPDRVLKQRVITTGPADAQSSRGRSKLY
ncbi:hypothetical protein RRG08_034449 [Elysia crispata]|uniref:Uncharacterized protein n=1 Tax=Elysia crispata TaxID=231223 RepID=A0AAE0XS71_9GAST|nr:hypothetical protein RRG08_034449 [Elysia crispata]